MILMWLFTQDKEVQNSNKRGNVNITMTGMKTQQQKGIWVNAYYVGCATIGCNIMQKENWDIWKCMQLWVVSS